MKKRLTLFLFLVLIFCSVSTTVSSQWFHSSEGLEGSVYCLAPWGSRLLAGAGATVLLSSDNGESWTPLDSGAIIIHSLNSQNAVTSVVALGTIIYAIAESDPFESGLITATLWSSSDSGLNWVELNANFQDVSTGITSTGEVLFATTKEGVFRSVDSAKTWKEVDTFSYATLGGYRAKLFAGNSRGLFVSTDQGNSWNPVQTLMIWPIQIVSSGSNMAALDYNPITYLSRVFYSVDSGSTWNPTSNDSAGSVANLTNIAISGSTLFVGSSSDPGADFYSTDWGASWHDLCVDGNCGDPGRETALVVSGPNLVLTSHTTGIYYYPLGGLASVTQTESPQLRYSSSPNPINSLTTISFTLPSASAAHLTLTDAAGRETPLLPTQWLDAGPHQVTWDASNYPSGVYLCRLVSGGESATQRLVVLH